MMHVEMQSYVERSTYKYFGKYPGIVVDNKDPLKLGRLRLRVPSLFTDDPSGAQSDEAVTDWVLPCAPYGGSSEQGFFFVPDIGANVWVEFEEGRLDSPIWVGTFWLAPNSTAQTPTEAQAADAPTHRVIKTASGHVIDLSDVSGTETIAIRHMSKSTVYLDEKGSVLIINKNGSNLYLNADAGEVTLLDESGNNVSMKKEGVTITNKSGSFLDISGGAIQLSADSIHLRSQTIQLGEGAIEPAILGVHFAAMYDAHVHPTALGPSGPPLPVPMPLSVPTNPAVSQSVKVK